MTRFTLTSMHHADATVATVTFVNGTTLLVADAIDHADTMYCVDCESDTTPVVRVTITSDEEWDYADGTAADKPLCSTCYGDDLFADAYDADAALDERAADDDADRRYHERKDEGY